MASPLSAQEKLRIQFRKSLRKGYAKNVELDPVAPHAITLAGESDETFIVRVDSTKGQHYWFTDRRLLCENHNGVRELLRYESVLNAHWMFKDLWTDRVKLLQCMEEASQFKANHFDRLEIELRDRLVVLEGLDQSYWPALHFFWWMTRTSGGRPTPAENGDSLSLSLPPRLTQTVKTQFTVRWKLLDRQNDIRAYWCPAGEAEAGNGGEQPAEE